MAVARPTDYHEYMYASFCHYLNIAGGHLDANDASYYNFLDGNKFRHEAVVTAVKLCHKLYDFPAYILHIDGRTSKIEGGSFYLTKDGRNIVSGISKAELPRPIQPKTEITEYSQLNNKEEKSQKKKDETWTAEEVVDLLTNKAHLVGRMLGTGYDLLEEMHGEWIKEWLLNPNCFKVLIHQAHRDSFKTSTLRLMLAILLILQPLKTVIVIRKSEDAVKEIVNGVSKILDTPLFLTFINILYPDLSKKGGFKKVVDTALAIDTNLNVSLSGEYQLRALGLGSPLTGKHSSLIVTDDIVSTVDRESEPERRSTIAKYQEMMNLLSNNKGFSYTRIINIGTPWHEEDAFSLMELGLRKKTDEQVQLEDMLSKDRTPEQNERIRMLNMKRGKFVFNCYQTRMMTIEDIEWKKQVLNDEMLFQANYMLNLVSDKELLFPRIDNVGKYSKSFFAESWEVFATIDAAFKGVDTTACCIGAYDWDSNNVVVHGLIWEGVSIEDNYIEIAEILIDNGVQVLYMETNTDKGLMGEKFREFGIDTVGYHESADKSKKIRRSIRPFWRESGELGLPSVQFVTETDPKFLSQIHNYKIGVKRDDAPDTLACLLLRGKFGSMSIRVT